MTLKKREFVGFAKKEFGEREKKSKGSLSFHGKISCGRLTSNVISNSKNQNLLP